MMDDTLFGELRAALNNHEEIPTTLLHLEEARTYIVEHIANMVAAIMCEHPPDMSHRYSSTHIMWCWYSVKRDAVPRSIIVGDIVQCGEAGGGFGFMVHTGCGELPPGVADAFDRLCGVLYALMPRSPMLDDAWFNDPHEPMDPIGRLDHHFSSPAADAVWRGVTWR